MLHVYSASPAAAMLSCLKKVESGCLNEFYESEIFLRSRNVTNENMLHMYIYKLSDGKCLKGSPGKSEDADLTKWNSHSQHRE